MFMYYVTDHSLYCAKQGWGVPPPPPPPPPNFTQPPLLLQFCGVVHEGAHIIQRVDDP